MLEETGFDISKLINKNEYIEAMIHDQTVRLYIIGYIPRDTKFQPRTRNEIKACEWFPLADLPSNKKDMTPKHKMGVSPNAFFMVLPFVKRMRRWVADRNPKALTKRTRHKSMGDIEVISTSKNKNKTISLGLQNEIQDYQDTHSDHNYKNHIHSQSYVNSNYIQHNTVHNPGNSHNLGNVHIGNAHNNPGNIHNPGNNNHHYGSAGKNNQGNRKDRKGTKRQLFTPQNTRTNMFSPVQQLDSSSPNAEKQDEVFFKFVAPSWANFKFDRRAILDCLT